jgi:hypothetical protein
MSENDEIKPLGRGAKGMATQRRKLMSVLPPEMMEPEVDLREKCGRKLGVHHKETDLSLIEGLGEINATHDEIAAVVGLSRQTVGKRFKDDIAWQEAFEKGKSKGRVSLRRLQWRHANSPTNSASVNMTIHLSKHFLGEVDKAAVIETHNNTAINIEVNGVRERLTAKFDALAERIQGRVAELATESGATRIPHEPVRDGD